MAPFAFGPVFRSEVALCGRLAIAKFSCFRCLYQIQ